MKDETLVQTIRTRVAYDDYCWHSEHGNLYESGAKITFEVLNQKNAYNQA